MVYERRILHFGPAPDDYRGELNARAIEGCWFELNRLGGCGAGEMMLQDRFAIRNQIELGDWIALERTSGDRWYLGRVEQRTSVSPAKVSFRLEGMGVELGEVFPGGFGPSQGVGVPPHRYARTDLFSYDPDYSLETVDSVNEPHEVVQRLLEQYVVPATEIQMNLATVESGGLEGQFLSMKFRGEESVRTILKELGVRCRHASWGVDENGQFYFLQKRTSPLATFREGKDLLRLEETRDRELIVNRVLLTGDYVYFQDERSGSTTRGFYRWRGTYVQPASQSAYGERRLKVWVPWIRTAADSRQFVREFFRVYSQPVNQYLVEVQGATSLPRPWQGSVTIEAADGTTLISGIPETIRVQFDHIPVLRMTIGAEDPRTHWPEPPHDERWEVGLVRADQGGLSDRITFDSDQGGGGGGQSSDQDETELLSSDEGFDSFNLSSSGTDDDSTAPTTDESDEGESRDSGRDSGDLSNPDSFSNSSDNESAADSEHGSEQDSEPNDSDALGSSNEGGNSHISSDQGEATRSDEESGEDGESSIGHGSESLSPSLSGSDDNEPVSDDSDADDGSSGADPSSGASDPSGGDGSGGNGSDVDSGAESDDEGSESGDSDGLSGSASGDEGEDSGSPSEDPSGGGGGANTDESGGGSSAGGDSEGGGGESENNSGGGDDSEVSSEDFSSSSNGELIVGCCNNPLPSELHVEIQANPACALWDGYSGTLTASSDGVGGWVWSATRMVNDVEMTLSVACVNLPPLNWAFSISGGDCELFAVQGAGGSCAPLHLVFEDVQGGEDCCGSLFGTMTITVTE